MDKRLIDGEAERRCDLFEVLDYIFGNAHTDDRHLTIFLQPPPDLFTRVFIAPPFLRSVQTCRHRASCKIAYRLSLVSGHDFSRAASANFDFGYSHCGISNR
jgi:hypothetical protein